MPALIEKPILQGLSLFTFLAPDPCWQFVFCGELFERGDMGDVT
jgi:hypothetical protein